MDKGKLTMENGQWIMDNGKSKIVNEHLETNNETWKTDCDGKETIDKRPLYKSALIRQL